ncbi:MAG: phosphoribosyltransferase [Solirubrobacteraceae bacterium]
MARRFADRASAGRELADRLSRYSGRDDLIVLGLPRGGVPVAAEVARRLHAPLDVFLVRKLGVPGHEELAFGAIASGGVRVLNADVIASAGVSPEQIAAVAERETIELDRREQLYRDGREPPRVSGRTVIVVDDGLATGATMRAAVQALRDQDADGIVVAVPIGAGQTCAEIAAVADELVCAQTPEPFIAVGVWYRDFTPTTDDQVRRLLAGRSARHAG